MLYFPVVDILEFSSTELEITDKKHLIWLLLRDTMVFRTSILSVVTSGRQEPPLRPVLRSS